MLGFLAVVAIIALLIFINALYVAAEFATVAASKSRIGHMAATGNRLAQMLLPIMQDSRRLDDYIAACQLGITASSLVLGAYGQRQVAGALAPHLASLGSMALPAAQSLSATGVLLALTILQVVLGELLPKSVAVQHREQVATAVVLPMRWSVALFAPFIWLFNGSANLLLRLFGLRHAAGHVHVHAPEEIVLLVAESQKGGLVTTEEQQLVRNAFRFHDLHARHVMTPRTRLVAAPLGSPLARLIGLAVENTVTRLPVYRDTLDNIVGFVHLKDLFRLQLQQREPDGDIVRPVLYVPESLPIADLWRQMNARREYMAVVLDEYGGTAGVATLSDVVEAIFGELHDEFDEEPALVTSDRNGWLRLRGDVLVADVNEHLDVHLPLDQADTLGGLVMSQLGRIPAVGDEVVAGTPPLRLRVESMDNLAVAEVSLRPAGGQPAPPGAGGTPPQPGGQA